MSDYGRNFEILQNPLPQNRLGRYTTGDDPILIGAPVKVDDVPDSNRRLPLALCTGATAPKKTRHGILVWESVYEGFIGHDPVTTRPSDIDTAPANMAVQLVSGTEFRGAFKNTETELFLQTASYTGRTMVAGIGATLALEEGDFLTPGVGNDTDGYWAKTVVAADAWLVVTEVLNDVGVVQWQMLF